MLNGLGLFAGICGLELGLERSGLSRPVCFVEKDPYCQKVLVKRFPEVPIWDDVTTFDGKEWKGKIDIISGGFPCQDISVAGKGEGIKEGTRSGLWSEFKRIISEIRPIFTVIENVPALLSWFTVEGHTKMSEVDPDIDRDRIGTQLEVDAIQEQGIATVISDLCEIGYSAEWFILSAADLGAPHLRKRCFIVAYPGNKGVQSCSGGDGWKSDKENPVRRNNKKRSGANAGSSKIRESQNAEKEVADTQSGDVTRILQEQSGGPLEWRKNREQNRGHSSGIGWNQWTVEPIVGRVAHRVPSRVDRLKCLGNAVVPQCAEYIGRLIMEAINGKR